MTRDMIRHLKIKMILTVMVTLTFVLGGLLGLLNISMYQTSVRQTNKFLNFLARNDGKNPGFRRNEFELGAKDIPPVKSPINEPFGDIRNYFSVKIDANQQILDVVSDFPIHYTGEEVFDLTTGVLNLKKQTGIYNGVYFLIQNSYYGKIIVFVDQRIASNQRALLLRNSLVIYCLSMIISFFISLMFTTWAIKPVKAAFEKQKQFIADASHELKTPIAVIGANIDVLSGEIGENKWLDYIKTENMRMSSLVKDLLYLAKYDNFIPKGNIQEVNISQMVEKVTLPFESVFFDNGQKLELNIAPDCFCLGDENSLKQAVVILLDNAMKNSSHGDIIRVSVKSNGNKKIVSVWNSGDGIDESEIEKIFERFYRVDSSRTRETGGYGLGLSIAKLIMDKHHGKISVSSKKGEWAEFSLIL